MSMKFKIFNGLVLMLGLAATAQAQDLTGCWRNVRNDVGPCYIRQYGAQLELTNEHGNVSRGYLTDANNLVAVDWGYDHAQIAAGGNVLVWDGNGEWDRDYSCGRYGVPRP